MVRSVMIVEMAGKPASLVKEKLTEHIGILEKVKDVTVHSIKVSEPRLIENSPGIYTCFTEADFEIPSFSRLTETMFDFMPSSIEVIEPGKVTMDSNEASAMLNNLSGRLHRYDEIAKVAKSRVQQLAKQLQENQKKLLEKNAEGKAAKKKTAKKTKKK